MAGKPNKTAIGIFVLGAISLTFAVILLYSGTKIFTEEYVFITYFDGSVKGLSKGSPVMYRGVQIGSVEDISITVVPSDSTLKIPVVFTIEAAKFGGAEIGKEEDRQSIQKAVGKYGMRAQLRNMNFLTGQLMVALEFSPGKEANYVGISEEYPEIPSVPTSLQQLQQTVENLPLREMIENLNSTVARIDSLLESLEKRQTLQSVEAAVADFQTLVQNIDIQVDPLMANLTKTAGAAENTFAEAAGTLVQARQSIEELQISARDTLDSAQAALARSEEVLQNFTGDSRLVNEMTMTLREFSETARSFRRLTDYLERHPEALLHGKSIR
jgi:paraquat-inducible protein B